MVKENKRKHHNLILNAHGVLLSDSYKMVPNHFILNTLASMFSLCGIDTYEKTKTVKEFLYSNFIVGKKPFHTFEGGSFLHTILFKLYPDDNNPNNVGLGLFEYETMSDDLIYDSETLNYFEKKEHHSLLKTLFGEDCRGSTTLNKVLKEINEFYPNSTIHLIELKGCRFQNVLFEECKVPFNELTSNRFIDGMKKIFELLPFINVERNQEVEVNIADNQAVSAGC